MANVEVGSTATLLSETTVGMPSQRFAPGYRVGYVTLSTGTRLFTHLAPDDELAPGQELRLELIVISAEHDTDVIAHEFVAKQREKSDA